ncbi:transmembrane protein 65 isoform X2 [Alligator sinensis]|uniref:Transmembrane protein 65 isoform X2 n=1 Tax=Alligator sinensis TaxID=38654 RepID=A0A3Q0H5L2_ALLSI|nr:transmembrane protein 65 isoform X2 [Alligator sinensis]
MKWIISPESTNNFEKLEVAPPSTGQLKHVFFHNALPFVGFGFLDNAIMIAAGTQIELSIGVVLGISTMAAAALGNLVSDLAGLGANIWMWGRGCRALQECHIRVTDTHCWSCLDMLAMQVAHHGLYHPAPMAGGSGGGGELGCI